MKTNILANIRFWALTMVCLMVFGVGNAWGKVLEFDMKCSGSKVQGWPTATGSSASSQTYPLDGTNYTFALGANVYFNSGYLMLKNTTTLGLPAIPGLKLTKVAITNSSGCSTSTSVSICTNTSGTITVSGGTAKTFSKTSTTYEYTLTGTSANTVYYIRVASANCQITNLVLTYSTGSSYMVTFNAQGGSCATSSLTEASNDAGVTLPAASPSASCASEGWEFYGWSASAVASATTTVPTIVGKAGDTYYPTSATTLHAVYVQGGEYTKVTSTGGITSGGKYLIAGYYSSHNHVMTNIYTHTDDYYMKEVVLDESNTTNHTYAAKDFDARWLYTITGSAGAYYIQDNVNATDNYIDTYNIDWYNKSYTSSHSYTISFSDAVVSGGCSICCNAGSYPNWVLFNTGDFGTTSSTWAGMQLYKQTETPTFHSTPSCCDKEVSVSESGSSHITSMAFSESSVATCGDAASRTIIITVTPASGYSLFGTTKPVFTKTSGTVAATIGSVTDNGDGTFSYECTFNSNDNGAGTFAISPGQFTNYRTLCCTKYDITLADGGAPTGGLFAVTDGDKDISDACEGTMLALEAVADDGYEFSTWAITKTSNGADAWDDVEDTGSATDEEIIITMPEYAITVSAAFACTEPTISAQPSGASYTQGDDATALSVTASAGTGSLDYQWQSSSDNSSWDDIDKETSSTYTPSTTSTGTMYYRVVVTNHECSESVESDAATIVVSAPSVCKTPTFSVSAGTYSSAQSVELSCGTDGATIRYTTNGDDPDGSSTAYSSAISVSVNTTIKAKAFKDGMTASSIASATYNIRCAAPTFSLSEDDIYEGSQSLTMSSATTGATVRYTTDESTPTGSSTAYSSALTVGATTTYKAKAYKDGMTESEESEVYVIIQCATPTFSVSAGTYNANQSVSISTTYGTTIYYTLDGNDPTTKSSTYSSALTIDATKTLKAIAVKSGCEVSDVASATYTLKCVTPTFSPVAGTYTGAQSVSMSCATTGSAIHYTTTGTDPTGSSATYSSAISVGTNQTVKAIATKSGWSDSDVASAAYTIKYNVAVASVENVTISATTPSIAEGSSADAAYGSTVSLSYSGVASGKTWGGWKVYKTGDASTTVTVTSNQFTMPAYNVTVSAFLYGVSDAIAWCDPDVTVTGDVHLTSTKDVYVHSTSGAGNLISISSSDMGSATKMEVAYLDENEDEVDKADSPFRLYNAAGSETVDGIDLDHEWETSHSIRYTPTDYDQRHNYKLQLSFKRGDKVLKTVTHDINGRSLPEEFAIVFKNTNDSKWYTLPSNLAGTQEAQDRIGLSKAIEVEVDNTTTPTKVVLAPNTRIYKGTGRNTATNNINGIRFTNDDSHWLQTGSSVNKLWLSGTNSDNNQVFYLKSTDFNTYELAMDPSQSPTKKLGIYSNAGEFIGYAASIHSNIYFLPIEKSPTELMADATDWTDDIIQLTAEGVSDVSATKIVAINEAGDVETSKVAFSTPATDTYLADFNSGIDFTGLTNEMLTLKWYNNSDELVGLSWAKVPSIILAGDNDEWSDFASAPTLDDIVVLSKPMTVGDAHAKAKQIVIDKNGGNTGKLTIEPNNGLEVASTVKVYNGTNFVATCEADLVLESSSAGNASLIFDNSNACKATVQMYSIGDIDGDTWNWQFMGTPFTSANALYSYYGSYLYAWNAGGYWDEVANGGTMSPFMGYCITQDEPTTYVMDGTLNPNSDVAISIPAKKEFVMANSWTAPISVCNFTETTLPLDNKTIYLYNTGFTPDSEHPAEAGTGAGTYVAMPINSAIYTGNYLIAPMQGFYVDNTSGSAATVTLKYNELVRPSGSHTDIVAGAMHAPKRVAAENEPAVMKIKATGSRYSERIVILEREDFSTGFDNGWDGKNLNEPGVAPILYALRADGTKDAVSAIPAYEGTVVGFRKGEDNAYTFSFEYNGDETLYLNDLQTQTSTLIDAEHTYAFSTESNDAEARFIISATPIQQMPTGLGNDANDANDGMVKVRKVIINDQLYIIRGGRMYSTEGQMVK